MTKHITVDWDKFVKAMGDRLVTFEEAYPEEHAALLAKAGQEIADDIDAEILAELLADGWNTMP